MSRTATVRRATATGACGAFLAASVLAAVPGGPVLQAVVSYDGSSVAVPGVRVLASLRTLHVDVVRGDAASLRRLATAPGVRSVAPDDAVQLTGRDDSGDNDHSAVLASQGLGGQAGKSGAGAGVRIAVVDTGVSDTAALDRASGRLVDAADASKVGDGKPVETGGTYTDGYGHGTFMAGIVAGGPVPGTDGKALGVAPGATVLVVRVANKDGSTSLSRVLGGLDWVASHSDQVDVVNLSLSHVRPHDAYGPDPLTDAVEQVRAAGVTVVVAAGNKRGTVGDPGFDPRVLTVGAADLDKGKVASFSGSDNVLGVAKPEVVASGVDVLGVLPAGSVIAKDGGTKHLPHGLFRGSGTSQATAIASGLAALFLAGNPGATPSQVKASLRCAAKNLKGNRDGAGLVRATTTVCAGPDGQSLAGSGDATGEGGFDASAWAASSWAASSWAASAWAASAWAASAWAEQGWGDES
ncbi:MAG: peptidase and in, kexin, sedolisin [Frankiales bacterium]|nr:peptidase and in, kexin, sedolisin [Frankiales bacterium]